MQASSWEVFRHGGKEILLDDEQESPHVDAEESLALVSEIHLFELWVIFFARESEACDGEKVLSAALVHPFQHQHQCYQFLEHLSLIQWEPP